MNNYNPVEMAYTLLLKVFESQDSNFSNVMAAIEEAIGYLGEALDV